MTPSTYLVTGGAGFIGSHLTDSLLAKGHRVVALDNLVTGSEVNLAEAKKSPNFRFVRGSVLDALLVDELLRECDAVVHLAAAVGVRLILENPLRSFMTNTRGTEIVLEAAHRHRRSVLVASTSEIYGKNASGPLAEDADRTLGSVGTARWWYSAAKTFDEILALAYSRELNLPTTAVRFFNTVGPRQSPAYGMVVPRLVRQAVQNKPLTVHGTGKQSRCFVHIADVVNALLLVLEHPEATGRVFNIGTQEETTIIQLAERIIARSDSKSTISIVPYEQAYSDGFEDMQRRVPDTERIRALTGWSPRFTLDDILDETIAEARACEVADAALV
ncbi:NAD-dependent epimerase/dehydratase family protein [Streptomyces sioyaensis]|uniref:NAD-dependent epimerase/dehydratase family protein n=1 Tax=Streptomyces sioyaensis TaxID=67364 RepID=UPI0034046439